MTTKTRHTAESCSAVFPRSRTSDGSTAFHERMAIKYCSAITGVLQAVSPEKRYRPYSVGTRPRGQICLLRTRTLRAGAGFFPRYTGGVYEGRLVVRGGSQIPRRFRDILTTRSGADKAEGLKNSRRPRVYLTGREKFIFLQKNCKKALDKR